MEEYYEQLYTLWLPCGGLKVHLELDNWLCLFKAS